LIATYEKEIKKLERSGDQQQMLEALRGEKKQARLDYIEKHSQAAFDACFDGVSRISSIVGAMREFAHPGESTKAAAGLHQALTATLTICRNEYSSVADVETDFADIPPVVCHIGDLKQVFLNLIVNAAHAIADAVEKRGSRGKIRVRTSTQGDQVRIAIEDTGIGIPRAVRERVFDPFFTTKDVGKGSGQGLAVARNVVVDQHGGSLTFESEEGKGTTFMVSLPIKPPDHAPIAPTG
jgi:two-component system NtrC family sensor kinase